MAKPRVTVHLIANAHLDPIWLWPWQAGLDEALCTCRTMCDLLDKYPDFIFTAGEAWRYHQIEQVDAPLFERICKHARTGRWAMVGGWWIQPDCNFPSGFGFEKQIEVGKRYFLDRFGSFPEVAYNVDSFGHAATLPGYMHAAGQRYYVMMRPQEHEMQLPARFFRWRGFVNGPEIVTFRIAGAYCTGETFDAWHINRALQDLPAGFTDTMCFIGVGDHGGGATVRMLDWIRENAEKIDGCCLVLSSPARFFQAIAKQAKKLPLVTGELQYHAIGCYSVQRGIKSRVRRTEHRLRQAELVADSSQQPRLEEAWQRLAFNHFHDILGGTSVASAYEQQYDYLGGAAAAADEILQHTLRRRLSALPDNSSQRLVLLNASDLPYDGYVEFEPWLRGGRWHYGQGLVDEKGRAVPYQQLHPEQANNWGGRMLFRASLKPGQLTALRLDSSAKNAAKPGVTATFDQLTATDGPDLIFGTANGISFPSLLWLALPRLDLIADGTDNWSHAVDRYPDGPITSPVWDAPFALDNGPLMAALQQTGRVGDSTLRAEWRVYAGEPFVELRLAVNWRERDRLLKLVLPLDGNASTRRDGIPGASLERPTDGREYPMRDWTLARQGKTAVAVVSPDIYALDMTPTRVRFTLLRSPLLTHHDPNLGMVSRFTVADQGPHEFRLRFYAGAALKPEYLDQQAAMLHRPLVCADLTRGMPPL